MKKKYYILYNTDENGITTEATAQLLFQNVRKFHGFLSLFTSNRGLQFILKVWKNLCKIFGISTNLSMFFYPETNGQSEIVN